MGLHALFHSKHALTQLCTLLWFVYQKPCFRFDVGPTRCFDLLWRLLRNLAEAEGLSIVLHRVVRRSVHGERQL